MATSSHKSGNNSKTSSRRPILNETILASKPVKELPPISHRSGIGNEFWGRRKLRPDGEGENFANMPLLNFCIRYDGNAATLKVPTRQHLNDLVKRHNPGGFTFIEISGLATADELLDAVIDRHFVLSCNKNIDVPGIPDHYLLYVEGKEIDGENATFKKQPVISTYEHDLVDHIAIAALPPSEVDKLVQAGQFIKDIKNEEVKVYAMTVLDRLMDTQSSYALMPASPENQAEADYKEFLWKGIEKWANIINTEISREFKSQKSDKTPKIKKLALSRKAFDKKIKQMQAVGR